MPERFGFIDASEIFIETPKHPDDHFIVFWPGQNTIIMTLLTEKPIFRKVSIAFNYYGW